MIESGRRVPAALHHICALALLRSGRTDEQTVLRIEQLWRMEARALRRQKKEQKAATYRRQQRSVLNQRYVDLCPASAL